MKTCRKCKKEKPLEDFRMGLQERLKTCIECLDKQAQYDRTYNNKFGGYYSRMRDTRLQAKYGITQMEYMELLTKQEYKCAICRKECGSGKKLAVDHSHETGEVRGLLCLNCNQGLGKFMDSPELLQEAQNYLRTAS